MKIRSVWAELSHADRQTDMKKLIIAFRNSAYEPKNYFLNYFAYGTARRPSAPPLVHRRLKRLMLVFYADMKPSDYLRSINYIWKETMKCIYNLDDITEDSGHIMYREWTIHAFPSYCYEYIPYGRRQAGRPKKRLRDQHNTPRWLICHAAAESGRLRLKCDGTRAETWFRLSAKRTNPFKSAGASIQSTTGSRGVRISGSNAGYTMFRGSVKSTG